MPKNSKTPLRIEQTSKNAEDSNEQLLKAEEETERSSSDASKARSSNKKSKGSKNSKAQLSDQQGEGPKNKKPKVSKTIQQSASSLDNPNAQVSSPSIHESEKEEMMDSSPSPTNENSKEKSNVRSNTPTSSGSTNSVDPSTNAESESTTPNQNGENQEEMEEEEEEEDNGWALTKIYETGEDERPDLPLVLFNNELSQLSQYEIENKRIYEKILETTNALPLSKGRYIDEMLVAHRVYKKAEFELGNFNQHARDCLLSEEEQAKGRDEFRAILFLADFNGLNPLMGASINDMVALTEVFFRQDEFFSGGDGDCCQSTWLGNRSAMALQILCGLLMEALVHNKHKRIFWSEIQSHPHISLEHWGEFFDVLETSEEQAVKAKAIDLDSKIAKLSSLKRSLDAQERFLTEAANQLAEKQVPQNLGQATSDVTTSPSIQIGCPQPRRQTKRKHRIDVPSDFRAKTQKV